MHDLYDYAAAKCKRPAPFTNLNCHYCGLLFEVPRDLEGSVDLVHWTQLYEMMDDRNFYLHGTEELQIGESFTRYHQFRQILMKSRYSSSSSGAYHGFNRRIN